MAFILCQGQPMTGDLQKQLDELRTRIRTLEKENGVLRTESTVNDSVTYSALRAEIFEAFANVSKLDFDFKSTSDKIAVTGLFTKLMQANNPTSDILGFRFTDIIFSASEKYFAGQLKNDGDKRRFSQVISKIIDNPVVSSLANTNPVTSVVAAIISCVAGFSTSRAEVEKEGGRIKEVSIDQKDAFESRNISAFRKELSIYIDFYDALIISSHDYLYGLEELNRKYAYLVEAVTDYKTDLYTGLGFKETNLLLHLARLLPDPATKGLNYGMFLHDPKIQKSHMLAKKYPVIQEAVFSFKKEYNTLLFNFLSDYIRILKTARSFPEGDIDKSKTDALINDIETFINSQKTREHDELDAFN
jgi:hypothetical protein